MPEARLVEYQDLEVGLDSVVLLLVLRRRDIAERFHQALTVVPRHPFERRVLHVFEPAPWPKVLDDLCFVQRIHGLGHRVVVRIAATADRGFDPGFR